jgi:septum formation protein
VPHVLILASASPRRAELLDAAGIPYEVLPADIDEQVIGHEAPDAYVVRLAREKAQAVLTSRPGRLVLGADTTVVLDGVIIGKPADPEDAARILLELSGKRHFVVTGVALAGPGPDQVEAAAVTTAVEFAHLDADEIRAYVASGEPMDKAGAYGIQGRASRYVRRIEGSYSNVVGLPVELVWAMCRARGIQVS